MGNNDEKIQINRHDTLGMIFCVSFAAVVMSLAILAFIFSFNAVAVEPVIETETITECITESTTIVETETIDILETEVTEAELKTEAVTEAPAETECITEVVIEASEDIYIPPCDLDYLACVIYQEAGGDYVDDNMRRMVADVVLNRVNDPRFPNTIYEVLTAPGQYGWNSYSGIQWPSRASLPYEQHAVERAYRIAGEVLNGMHSDIYGQGYIWQAEFPQGNYCFLYYNTYFGR